MQVDTTSHHSEWPSLTSQQVESAGQDVVRTEPSALLGGMQTCAAPVENSLKCLQKLKMELSFDPVIPLLGLHPEKHKTPIQKYLCTPMFIAALFAIAKCWKQPTAHQ